MNNTKISVVGLGYVGLPLAIEFGKKYNVVGVDIDTSRIEELRNGYDRTKESNHDELIGSSKLVFSSNINDASDANIYIITVPTPVDKHNKPDLTPLIKATSSVAGVLKKGDIVIYESTVYPGCTEEDCVPVLENKSGLKFNLDFFCGYSPERINPGDKEHTLTKIKKITSGSTPEIAEVVDKLYDSILIAGTHKASSIKVAEAAKVIENAQRDINIAFVNELAKIFNKLEIDTSEVLAAASTKWNFLPFKPGLVGGHCIGVDPYYLAQKAQEFGYHPEIILAGRRLNDGMGAYIADEVIKLMVKQKKNIFQAKVLLLGITFKENCPDIRNSRVIDIYKQLLTYHVKVDVTDPWADFDAVKHEYGIQLMDKTDLSNYDSVIVAVSHKEFLSMDFSVCKKSSTVLYDVKGLLDKSFITASL